MLLTWQLVAGMPTEAALQSIMSLWGSLYCTSILIIPAITTGSGTKKRFSPDVCLMNAVTFYCIA